jgi:hypothetical protein
VGSGLSGLTELNLTRCKNVTDAGMRAGVDSWRIRSWWPGECKVDIRADGRDSFPRGRVRGLRTSILPWTRVSAIATNSMVSISRLERRGGIVSPL